MQPPDPSPMDTNIQAVDFGVSPARPLAMRVVGVGGAGCNIVDHLASTLATPTDHLAINTDAQALEVVRHARPVALGARITRGLGAGGDPELGRSIAEEQRAALEPLVRGSDIVLLVAGLGGGTGTGVAPVVARLAREAGALVLSLATLPFECEGARRRQQAQDGLEELREASDAVIVLPNQRLLKLVDEQAGVLETLHAGNNHLAQGVQGLARMLTRPGIINVDFASLCAVLRGRHAESALACAEARGADRALEVVDRLLVSPFLDAGQALHEAEAVLVSIAGGTDLTMGEVNRIMEQIGHQCAGAHVIMGTLIDDEFLQRVSVTLVAARFDERRAAEARPPRGERGGEAPARGQSSVAGPADPPVMASDRAVVPGAPMAEVDTAFFRAPAVSRPPSRFVPPPPENLPLAKQHELLKSQRRGAGKGARAGGRMRQELLPLEIVSKGRFEKSEPTIHRGEDLDVPTYIRRGVALN